MTLYAYAHPFRKRGFGAEARKLDGEFVAEKFFVETAQGLEATNSRGARQLLQSSNNLLRRLFGALGTLLLAVLLLGCGQPSGSSPPACDPIPPAELPSGAAPGEPQYVVWEGVRHAVWGSGNDEITQIVVVDDAASVGGDANATVRGQPAVVLPVGDPPLGEITIAWSEAGCRHTVWMAPGHTLDDAVQYAARY